MAEKLKFKVLRRHDGDRMYEEGETREGTQADLGHLVPKVLELLGPVGAKSEAAPLNKMEKRPDVNKTDYESMTVAALKDLAERRKVDLGDATKKADIIAAFELSDESQANK